MGAVFALAHTSRIRLEQDHNARGRDFHWQQHLSFPILPLMNEASLIQVLRTSSDVKRILEYDFDFRLMPIGSKSALFHFGDGTIFELVGTDASGGEFALCERRDLPTRPFLYVSSEGQAGVLARSLEHGLSVIIDLPYWYDCLKFSGDGQLSEMRRVVPLSEGDLVAETPQIDFKRKVLRERFGISPIPDVIQELHSSVTGLSSLYPVSGPDGWVFGTLFGKFTAMSNAAWRRRLAHDG
jgi:hypothetical protein